VLAGSDSNTIVRLVRLVTEKPPNWEPPAEYLANNVAATVTRIMLGHSESEERSIPETKLEAPIAPVVRQG